ncbi:MAG TPA: hypothetical protein VNW06_11675 [Cytophagaceae bacterium]|jgi:hypothetical protein|nr:hypothetical protein [Cytophagaceae bacterium]
MAGKITNSIRKLKASSLIEITVAMVIITFIFTMAFSIYVRVIASDLSISEFKMVKKLDQLSWESKRDKRFISEDIIENNYTIEKKITTDSSNSKLLLMELTAYDQDQKIVAQKKELIIE